MELAAGSRIGAAIRASVANDKFAVVVAEPPAIRPGHGTRHDCAALLDYRAMRAIQQTEVVSTGGVAYDDLARFKRSPGGCDIKRYIRVTPINKNTDI